MTVYVPFSVTFRDVVPLAAATLFVPFIGPSKVIFVPEICAPAYSTTIYFAGFHTSVTSAEAAAGPSFTDTPVMAGCIKVNALEVCVEAPDDAVASACRYHVSDVPAVPLLSVSCVPLVVSCQP